MSAPVPTSPEAVSLRQRFAGVRRRLRLVTLFRGTGWLVALVLATVALAGLIDWYFHLPGLLRAAILTGLLAGTGVVVFRALLRPLGARTDDLSLALAVEDRYPSLNDSLASTVQFLEHGPAENVSGPLQREAVRRALGKARGCDFNQVVDARGLVPAIFLGAISFAVAVVLLILSPALAGTAILRLADPFGAHGWPTQTRLFLDEPKTRIGRGEAYQVTARVVGVIPADASLELSFKDFPASTKKFRITPEDDKSGSLLIHLKPDEVQRSFRFRIFVNDAETPSYAVEVLPPPVLVSLDGQPSPQLTLHFPAYTDLPSPQALPPGNGNIDAVFGTSIELRAAADRPLRKAWIEYIPDLPETATALMLGPLSATNPVSACLSAAGSESVLPVRATLDSKDPRRFAVAFQPRIHGTYAIQFEDETGLLGTRKFELRLQADPPPSVRMDRPSQSRDVLTMLPTASLQVEVIAEDSQYALRDVFLEYRTALDETPRLIPLYDHSNGFGPAGFLGGAFVRASVPQLRPVRLEINRQVPLRLLTHAQGRPLQDGDVVILQACASDFDDVTVDKAPGRSHQVEIRIVGREALNAVVSQEETQVQQDIVRLREKEREALKKVEEVEKKLRKGEKLTPEDMEKLVQAEQLQQQIRERVGDRKEGLRADVQRLRETLAQNGQRNSAARDRMDMVAKELERLAEKELEEIEPKLTAARKMAELLDEKTRAERASDLEKKAREAEREAKAAEMQAKKDAEAAARAEELAEKAADEKEKSRREAEAKKLREKAAELEKKSREFREQAARDRRDAGQVPDQKQPREALADARRQQEEVEKTLGALLQEMEPSSNTREIKSEAGRIREEQKALEKETEELAQKEKGPGAKLPADLTPQEKAELEALREAQKRLEERSAELIDKMKKMADKRQEKDPETAQELRDAAEKAEKGGLTSKMKEAAEQIQNNKLNDAAKQQREALAELQKLAKNLEDRREQELDRLIKKLKQAEEEVEKLLDEQEKLKKKAEEARKIDNPDKREEELKKLAKKQQELQQRTQELLKQLSRMRSARANQALGQAVEEMEGANRDLTRGLRDEKQDDVLDRLDEARDELEKARKQAEEELGREQLARIADVITRIKERQEAHNREGGRIQAGVQQNGNWTRGLRSSLSSLGENQKALGTETTSIARKDLPNVPVFARLLEKVGEAMNQAGERAATMVKEPPEVKALPDEELNNWQTLALRRLNQLLEAVKESQDQPRPLAGGAGGGGGGGGNGGDGGDGGGRGGDDGLPPPAQLKLLRGMQKEINDRTEEFRKKHPDPEKWGAKEKTEMDGIQKEQKEVADLLERLIRPEDKNPEADPK